MGVCSVFMFGFGGFRGYTHVFVVEIRHFSMAVGPETLRSCFKDVEFFSI